MLDTVQSVGIYMPDTSDSLPVHIRTFLEMILSNSNSSITKSVCGDYFMYMAWKEEKLDA